MPFEPSGGVADEVRCTTCSELMPAAGMSTHRCVPAVVRARQEAGMSIMGDGVTPAVSPAEVPVDGGVWQAEQDEPRPITFTLAGQEFRGVDDLSIGLQMDLAAAWDEGTVATSVVVKLIRGIVHPDDEKRYERLIYAKDATVDAEELRDALVSVVRQMAGRPSPSSSPSPRGRAPGGDGSTAVVSSPGWNPGPSASGVG